MATLVAGNLFVVRTFKRATGNPAYVWNNTYEIGGGTSFASFEAAGDMAEAIATAEAQVHTNIVEYVKATVSTWEEDKTPYNPDSFVVREIDGLMGARSDYGSALPRWYVLHAKRQAASGRSGRLYFRGALGESDVIGNLALTAELESAVATDFEIRLATLYTAVQSAIETALGTGAGLRMISIVEGATVVRAVTGLVLAGVTHFDDDFKYYDKGGILG